MPFAAFFNFAVLVLLKTARAERDAVIKFHSRADLTGLANYHAGAVIDKKMRANLCARMDVDTGTAVCPLGHNAGDQGHLVVEKVRQSINRDRFQGWISEDDFLITFRSRITFICSVDVRPKNAT